MMGRHGIVQNSYYVRNLDDAIQRFHRMHGIGPFIVHRDMVLTDVWHRGRPSRLHISAAFVQAGPIQIELVTQHDDAPSTFREMFGPDAEGFHHCAVMPDDPEAAVREYATQGFSVATSLRAATGSGAYFVDTRAVLGHVVEVYVMNGSLRAHYEKVRLAAEQWDGKQLTIESRALNAHEPA